MYNIIPQVPNTTLATDSNSLEIYNDDFIHSKGKAKPFKSIKTKSHFWNSRTILWETLDNENV